jgi:hypothetical protein
MVLLVRMVHRTLPRKVENNPIKIKKKANFIFEFFG